MKSPGGEAGRSPALVRNRRRHGHRSRMAVQRVGIPPGCLMSPTVENSGSDSVIGGGPSPRCTRVGAPEVSRSMSLIRRRTPVATDGGPPRAGAGRTGTARPVGPVRRLVRGALVVAAGTAALSLAGPFALRPFVDVAGAAGTAGSVSVAFVLDFGGTPATLVTGCVSVPDTDTRYDALSAFIASRGLAPASYAASGLLCSINGVPASGCGQTVPGGYIYWSYFTGGRGGWSYSSTGASGTVTPNDVEGWRFQDPGSGRPNDPAPRSAGVYRLHCATVRPTPTPTTTATTAAVGPGGRSAAGGGTAQPQTAAASGLAGTSKKGKGGQSDSLIGSGSGSGYASGSGTVAASGNSGSSDGSGSYPPISIPPDPEVGVVATHHVTPGGGPDPLIVGGVLVAGLAVAAWARWRRRPRTP